MSDFAERYGATILVVIGAALCFGAIAAALMGNSWAQVLAGPGITGLIYGAVLARSEGEVKVLGIRSRLRLPGSPPSEPRKPQLKRKRGRAA